MRHPEHLNTLGLPDGILMPLSSAACKRFKESLPSLDAPLELSSDWKAELFPSSRMQHRCEIRTESRTESRTLTTHSPSVLPCMDCWKMTASPPWLRYNGRFSLRRKLNSKLAYANAVTRSNKKWLMQLKIKFVEKFSAYIRACQPRF